jgi:hypothetical protein
MVGVCPSSVQTWRKSYIDGGIDSLISHRMRGSVSHQFGEEEQMFLAATLSNPKNGIQGYAELKCMMDIRFERNFHYITLLKYCQRNFGTKIKVARKNHVKKDEEAVTSFTCTPYKVRVKKLCFPAGNHPSRGKG